MIFEVLFASVLAYRFRRVLGIALVFLLLLVVYYVTSEQSRIVAAGYGAGPADRMVLWNHEGTPYAFGFPEGARPTVFQDEQGWVVQRRDRPAASRNNLGENWYPSGVWFDAKVRIVERWQEKLGGDPGWQSYMYQTLFDADGRRFLSVDRPGFGGLVELIFVPFLSGDQPLPATYGDGPGEFLP